MLNLYVRWRERDISGVLVGDREGVVHETSLTTRIRRIAIDGLLSVFRGPRANAAISATTTIVSLAV